MVFVLKQGPSPERFSSLCAIWLRQMPWGSRPDVGGTKLLALFFFHYGQFLFGNNYKINCLNYIHIWQESQQLSCGNTCEIWMWYTTGPAIYYDAHDSDIIMSAMTSKITGISIVWRTVWSGTHERKHQSSASLAFVRGIHWWSVDSPHKRPVTWKVFPFDDVIMSWHWCVPHTLYYSRPCYKKTKRYLFAVD